MWTCRSSGGNRRVADARDVDSAQEIGIGVTYDINTDALGHLTAGVIGTGAFQRAGVYQDIPVRFVLPPGVQWIDPRLSWNGGPATWIDTISIVEEKIFGQDDVTAILE
jgi:hypothetical protein